MSSRPGVVPEFVTLVTIAVGIVGFSPSVAEAQATGTMQVSATVVPAQSSFQALSAAHEAISVVRKPITARRPVNALTVARVSVRREPKLVVVTIDYLR